MRHAQAQMERFGFNDRDRAITINGMHELDRIRPEIPKYVSKLDLILCSNAKRTRQTLEGIRPALPSTAEIRFDDDLYNASFEKLWTKVTSLPARFENVLVISHNPGLTQFVREMTDQSIHIDTLPTCAMAIFEGHFDAWYELQRSKVTLANFLK